MCASTILVHKQTIALYYENISARLFSWFEFIEIGVAFGKLDDAVKKPITAAKTVSKQNAVDGKKTQLRVAE